MLSVAITPLFREKSDSAIRHVFVFLFLVFSTAA